MKENLCIVFLAVSCFGQNVPSDNVPAVPSSDNSNKVAAVPSIPDTSKVTGVLSTPNINKVLDGVLNTMGNVPAVLSTVDANKQNSVLKILGNSDNTNKMAAIPSISDTNNLTGVLNTPNMNKVLNGVLNTLVNNVPAVLSTLDANKQNSVLKTLGNSDNTNKMAAIPSISDTNNLTGVLNTPNMNKVLNGVLNTLVNSVSTVPSTLANKLNMVPNALNTNILSNAIPSSNGPAVPSILSSVPVVPSTPGVDNVLTNVPLLGLQSKIERPCQPYDKICIRRYFLKNSQCKPAVGTVPDPLYRTLSNQFYSRVNITNTNLNIRNRGLNNARIVEFYINRDTDKLVMGILFQGLSQASNDSFFRYYRRGKEPIITYGYASVTFNSLYVTATIPQVENLRLDKADVFAFSDDLIPKIELDPKLAQSSDPAVPRMFAEFLLNVPVDVAEFLLTESAYYAAAYIQYVICDFGLQLV